MTLVSFAGTHSISTQYTSLKYRNYPTNHFLSVYLSLEDVYSFYAGDLDFRIGVNALATGNKSSNFQLFQTVHKNRVLVNSLSLDYYPTHQTLLSVGRQAMKLNLLQGSLDGLLAVGKFDTFSIQAFYFNRYSVLYPSYYVNNKVEDLYGVNLHYDKDIFEGELTYFAYDDHTVSDLYVALHLDAWTLGAEHLFFDSDTLADEKAYKAYVGYRSGYFYGELGVYHVYEGGLSHVFDLGGSEFQSFRLHGFLNRDNAKNIYTNLQYKQKSFNINLHLGYTEFDDISDPSKSYIGREVGIGMSKTFDELALSATLLTQKSDEPLNAGKRTTWVQTQLKYRF